MTPTVNLEAGADDLVERLNAIWRDGDHERLCQGREYSCTCGFDERTEATAREAAAQLAAVTAENVRLREALDSIAADRFTSFNDAPRVSLERRDIARDALSSNPQCEKTCVLRAAAPDLLEACKTALSELRDYADTHPSFKEIADAIAKAEGTSDLDARMQKGADEFAAILKGSQP